MQQAQVVVGRGGGGGSDTLLVLPAPFGSRILLNGAILDAGSVVWWCQGWGSWARSQFVSASKHYKFCLLRRCNNLASLMDLAHGLNDKSPEPNSRTDYFTRCELRPKEGTVSVGFWKTVSACRWVPTICPLGDFRTVMGKRLEQHPTPSP